ncbi:MAG: RNA-binding S4 domain-containing protein [Fusobacteria bacterium]|nr:RNA-binding S4 domain-containing protein [Fusobacteriota bacterium]
MRLDKFLKVSRIIKRRTVAKKVGENEKITVNGVIRKPSYTVKENDIIELSYFDKIIKFQVVEVPTGNVKKDDSKDLVKIID